jgi:SSS family solute:Na+ symporter
LRGLFLAALFGAIQSTINAVLNSSATVFTLDIYQRILHKKATDKQLVSMGVWSSVVILIIAIVMAGFIGRMQEGLFMYIQTLYAFFAPPFAAVFLLGILSKRINAKGACSAVFGGFAFAILIKMYLAFRPELFGTAVYNVVLPFSNQSLITWAFSAVVCVAASLLTAPPRPEQISGDLTLNWKKMDIFDGLGDKWYQSVILWWGLFAVIIISLIIIFSGKVI